MAEALYRWNGSDWVLVSSVAIVVAEGSVSFIEAFYVNPIIGVPTQIM